MGKLGIFSKVFLIINKIASFYTVLWYFDQNSTLYAYLIFVKIPPCTLIRACSLIRETRVVSRCALVLAWMLFNILVWVDSIWYTNQILMVQLGILMRVNNKHHKIKKERRKMKPSFIRNTFCKYCWQIWLFIIWNDIWDRILKSKNFYLFSNQIFRLQYLYLYRLITVIRN